MFADVKSVVEKITGKYDGVKVILIPLKQTSCRIELKIVFVRAEIFKFDMLTYEVLRAESEYTDAQNKQCFITHFAHKYSQFDTAFGNRHIFKSIGQ